VSKSNARVAPRLAQQVEPPQIEFSRGTDLYGALVQGDFAGVMLSASDISESRFDGARLTGGHFERSTIADCVWTGCDLAGAVFDGCTFTRVEFLDCRLSGVQAGQARFSDVAFVDCKGNGANFRLTTWTRSEFLRCDLEGADFYDSRLPATLVLECDLTGADFSKADLAGSRLNGSTLDRTRVADSLHRVTIGSDQVIPAALALFAALDISVDDDA